MLAGKKRRVLSMWMSLVMALGIGIPSGVYGTERQPQLQIHVHGQAGFCSDGYYYTGKCIPVMAQEPEHNNQETTVDQPTGEAPGTSIQPSTETSASAVEHPAFGHPEDDAASVPFTGALPKQIGADEQIHIVKTRELTAEKDDAASVTYKCQRYPYFTVTFVDQQGGNKQTDVHVVPDLLEQFPLTPPDFKDQNGNPPEFWLDQKGKPIDLDQIAGDETVYAKWEEQAQPILPENGMMVPSKKTTKYYWEDKSNAGEGGAVCVEYYQDHGMHDWPSGTTLTLPRNAFPFFFVKAAPGYENVRAAAGSTLNDISCFGNLMIGYLHDTPRRPSDFLSGPVNFNQTAKNTTGIIDLLSNYAVYAYPAYLTNQLYWRYSLDGTDQMDSSQINLSHYQSFFYWSPWLDTKQTARTIDLTADQKPDSVLIYKANAEGAKVEGIPKPIAERTDFETKLAFDGIMRSDGYEFLGWSKNPKATAPEYTKNKNASILMDGDKTLYAVWSKKPISTGVDAKFFIRLDGQVPVENGTIQHAHADYTVGELSGKVDGKACWTDYSGVIDEQTGRIKGALVEEAFASVQTHIQEAPSDEAIQRILKQTKSKLTFHPKTQRVVWYVVKQVPSEGNAWHVDGVICSKYAHEMLQYHGNAGGDKTVKGIPSVQLYEKNDDAPIIFKGITRTGYQFCGWSEDLNAAPENLEYPKDGEHTTIRMDGEKHLYAVWQAKPSPKPEVAWRIIYDANEPTDSAVVIGMPDDGKDKRNGVYELSAKKPDCSEGVDCTYEFKGWSLQDGKDGKEQAPVTSVTIKDSDVTVYAIWERIPKDDPAGGGDQGGGTDPSGGDQDGSIHDRDHGGRDHSGNETVIISDSEVPLASQPASPPEVTIPDQAIPLASNPEEQAATEETGVPLSGISKLPKTGGIGAGIVIGIGALLIAAGLLLRRKERRADR